MDEIEPLIELQNVCLKTAKTSILTDINLQIRKGETFGLIGLSGSGKSTIGRIILGLTRATSGNMFFDGRKLDYRAGGANLLRKDIQMIFQNPLAAFNPRRQIGESLELPMRNFGVSSRAERIDRIDEVLTQVGLDPRFVKRYPHELSGGQCQRAGIARALISRPRFIFLDEPLSALDVSVQAQVANLLKDLQESLGLTYLFVANNLLMGRYLSDRVAVLKDGQIIESGPVDDIFQYSEHPFTRRLISASLSARCGTAENH